METLDVKNAFHTALKEAVIDDFTWHDFRHDYASRLVMAGVSLRAVAELLGHRGSAWSCDTPTSRQVFERRGEETRHVQPGRPRHRKGKKRAKSSEQADERSKSRENPRNSGSSAWTRTRNPPVNRFMQVPVSCWFFVGLATSPGCYLVFGEEIVHRLITANS